MLHASGVNHGFVRSMPHLLGISLGFAVLFRSAGLGLGAVLGAVPALHRRLTAIGAVDFPWLARKIA